MSRLDAATVRDALRVGDVLDYFGVKYRGRREIRLRQCVKCGHTSGNPSRTSWVLDADSGAWIGHACGCRGGKLALVAACAGLDVKRAYPEVIELGGKIAGVTPDMDHAEVDRILAKHRAEREDLARRAADERARGEAMLPELWESLPTHHRAGEAYLAGRGLDPAALRDVVRYRRDGGSPAVLLYALDGRPINICTRLIRPTDDGTKHVTLSLARVLGIDEDDIVGGFSTRGTMIGRVSDIDPEGLDVAIVSEGIADTIAATLAFPTCAVLGANGWGQMVHVAAAAAPRLVAARGWLLVAVHNDERGIEGAGEAMRAAVSAGLELGRSVRAIEIGEHKDLADAWKAGWRPSWTDLGVAS